jgi:hypothetical protein
MVTVTTQLARLPDMDHRQLRTLWREIFRETCPFKQNREFMIRRIAHQLQLRRYGGLDSTSRKRLDTFVDERTRRMREESRIVRPSPGTVIVRQYKGEQHRVAVLMRGFEYRKIHYNSLTEVAKAITGTHCSGPMFFGLTRTSKPKVRR